MLLTFSSLFFSVTVPEMRGKLYFANSQVGQNWATKYAHTLQKKNNYFLGKKWDKISEVHINITEVTVS